MRSKNITYRRESARKCLLMLMLFLGICSFAGLVRSTVSSQPKTYTIELVDTKKARVAKKFVCYSFFVKNPIPFIQSDNYQQAILAHARLTKLRFEVMLRTLANRQPEYYLLHQKTIPQSFKESLIFRI